MPCRKVNVLSPQRVPAGIYPGGARCWPAVLIVSEQCSDMLCIVKCYRCPLGEAQEEHRSEHTFGRVCTSTGEDPDSEVQKRLAACEACIREVFSRR